MGTSELLGQPDRTVPWPITCGNTPSNVKMYATEFGVCAEGYKLYLSIIRRSSFSYYCIILFLATDIASDVINVTLVITSENCTDERYNQPLLWRRLNETVTNELESN